MVILFVFPLSFEWYLFWGFFMLQISEQSSMILVSIAWVCDIICCMWWRATAKPIDRNPVGGMGVWVSAVEEQMQGGLSTILSMTEITKLVYNSNTGQSDGGGNTKQKVATSTDQLYATPHNTRRNLCPMWDHNLWVQWIVVFRISCHQLACHFEQSIETDITASNSPTQADHATSSVPAFKDPPLRKERERMGMHSHHTQSRIIFMIVKPEFILNTTIED